jgi:hypothetical protein
MRVLGRWRRAGRFAACGLAALLVAAAACAPAGPRTAPPALVQRPAALAVASGPGVMAVRGPLPFPFEQNVGQAGPSIAYLLRVGDLQVGFRERGVSLRVRAAEPPTDDDRLPVPGRHQPDLGKAAQHWSVEHELVGAREAAPVGTMASETAISYLGWPDGPTLTGVPAYHQIAYLDAWGGVDVVYERGAAGLKSTYRVAPGADPQQIQLFWRGALGRIAEDGALELQTPLGVLRDSAPVAWQERDGQREPVTVRWTLREAGVEEPGWGFALGAYDPARSLVIDPTLLYASYLGGTQNDVANAVALDSTGAIYVTGHTDSAATSFPDGDPNGNDLMDVPGFDQTHNGNADIFVARLAPGGTSLVYATYLGGAGAGDGGNGIAVDSTGATYVVGDTDSPQATFPNGSGFGAGAGQVNVPGFDQSFNGGPLDGFVVKLAPDGQSLIYASYLGGAGLDTARDVAVGADGAAYITGFTTSPQASFPNGAGFGTGAGQANVPGFDQIFNGVTDAFVVKLAPDGRSLVYATYIGGDNTDTGSAIVVDGNGLAYVAGSASSTGATFPNGGGTLPFEGSGFDITHNGKSDAFVVKLSAGGTGLSFVTYLGGSEDDSASDIAVDASGAIYVTGAVNSTQANFPNGGSFAITSVPGFDQTFNGGSGDAFVVKLAPGGGAPQYVTYLGGNDREIGTGIAVDANGVAYVAGLTYSTQTFFPNGNGFGTGAGQVNVPGFNQTFNGGRDAFLVKLAPNGATLLDATYLGGSDADEGYGLAIDGSGTAYLVGYTASSEATFPDGDPNTNDQIDVPGFDRIHNGGPDGFLALIGPTATLTPTVTPTPTVTSTPIATATPTPTSPTDPGPGPGPAPSLCAPRPNVEVTARPLGGGRLEATVRALTLPATPANGLEQIVFNVLQNGSVQFNGATVSPGAAIPLGGANAITFVVTRQAAGQPTTVTFTVRDRCGDWPSFVGGGPGAF